MKYHAYILAVGAAACALRCSEMVVDGPEQNLNVADVETAWNVVHDIYPFLAFKKINWDSLHAVYSARAVAARGDEVYQVLYDMLHELHDGHVQLIVPGNVGTRTYYTPRELRDARAFDPHVVRRYFHEELALSGDGQMEYGILDGNVGYMRIATFVSGNWVEAFPGVLDHLRETKGMIIDLRHNGGGSSLTGAVVVSRFITEPLELWTSYYRGRKQTGPPLQPAGPYAYTRPVVVLVNGKCFSATEDVAEIMRRVPTFTLVGDTTAGASGAPQKYTLPSGKVISVSTVDIRRSDNQPIEWNGIPPDVRVPQTEADVRAGIDRQLGHAYGMLRDLP